MGNDLQVLDGQNKWPCGSGGSRSVVTLVRIKRSDAGRRGLVGRPNADGRNGYLSWLRRSKKPGLPKLLRCS